MYARDYWEKDYTSACEIPVSLEPSVMRVYGPSLIFTTNSSRKWGAKAPLTMLDVFVLADLWIAI